jgi:hypothetical protein
MVLSADKTVEWRCFVTSRFGEGSTGGARENRVAMVKDGSEEDFIRWFRGEVKFKTSYLRMVTRESFWDPV